MDSISGYKTSQYYIDEISPNFPEFRIFCEQISTSGFLDIVIWEKLFI